MDTRAPLPTGFRRFWRDEHSTGHVRIYPYDDSGGVPKGAVFMDLKSPSLAVLLGLKLKGLRREGVELQPMEELFLNLYQEGVQRGFAAGWNTWTMDRGLWWRIKIAASVLFGRTPGRRSR